MTMQTFHLRRARRPLTPFRLVLSSGQADDLRRPEIARPSQTSILVEIVQTDERVPAEFKVCLLPRVTTVEPLSAGEARQVGTA